MHDSFFPDAFFDLDGQAAADLFEAETPVWQALDRIKPFIQERMKPNVVELRATGDLLARNAALWQGQVIWDDLEFRSGDTTKGKFEVYHQGRRLEGAAAVYAGAALMDDRIEIRPGAVVEPGALIKGPTIIGEMTEVRQGAYVRGSCLVGRSCVVGHATELKNAVMMDNAKAGHFAYIGDSILGQDVNLGAGTKLANLKIIAGPIRIRLGDQKFLIERRKVGAILGDHVETGCNSVTSPGVFMGPGCLVSPNTTVSSGYYRRRTVIRPRHNASLDFRKLHR